MIRIPGHILGDLSIWTKIDKIKWIKEQIIIIIDGKEYKFERERIFKLKDGNLMKIIGLFSTPIFDPN
jgi:hypothetical protein